MYFLDSPATLMIMLVILLVSGYALQSRQDLIDRLAIKPERIREHGEYYRLVSAWLVHGGLAHLAFNLFTLFFFGPALEVMLGTGAFLMLFFGSELASGSLTYRMHRDSRAYTAVGASGAISGVLFAYALYRPTDYIYLFGALPMPAWLFAVLFVGVSVYAMRTPGARGGVAHEAHLGGAVGGLLIALALNPGAAGAFLRQLGL